MARVVSYKSVMINCRNLNPNTSIQSNYPFCYMKDKILINKGTYSLLFSGPRSPKAIGRLIFCRYLEISIPNKNVLLVNLILFQIGGRPRHCQLWTQIKPLCSISENRCL